METEIFKLSELNLDPKNTRIHDSHNLEVIKKSLKKFGQYRPFVVQKEGMIIRVGNGMYAAMQQLGWTEGSAIVKDLTDEEATTLSILDNKASDLSIFDDDMLKNVMADLSKEELDLTGFVDLEITTLFDEPQEPKEPSTGDTGVNTPTSPEDAPGPSSIKQYQIIFDNDDNYKEFVELVSKVKGKYELSIADSLVKFLSENLDDSVMMEDAEVFLDAV